MKILHISTGFPISFQGGITNYVRILAETQAQNGHDVTVIGAPDQKNHKFKYIEYQSKKILPFSFSKMLDDESLAFFSSVLSEHQFDLVHIHMMLDVDRRIHTLLKEIPYVISLHDYFFICPRIQMVKPNRVLCTKYCSAECSKCISALAFNPVFMRGFCKLNAIAKFAHVSLPTEPAIVPQNVTEERFREYKKLLEAADRVLPVSNRVREIYADSGTDAKYQVLHIGNISADQFTEYQFNEHMEDRKIKVTMLGSINYVKGGEILLKLAKGVDANHVELHFWGRSNEYADAIKKAGVIDHGTYTQDKLAEILRDSDLGLVLSVWEDNAPQVVMELLNNHVPVIGTRMGGITDFVNETNGLVFYPYDEKEICRAVDFLNTVTLDEIEQLKRSIHRTKTTAEHYREIMEIYEEILARS